MRKSNSERCWEMRENFSDLILFEMWSGEWMNCGVSRIWFENRSFGRKEEGNGPRDQISGNIEIKWNEIEDKNES